MVRAVRSAIASCSASDCGEIALVEIARDPVDDRVPRLVGDDVVREAGVDRLQVVLVALRREVKELQAVGIAVVEGVGPFAGARDYQQLGRPERPFQRPAEGVGFLEHLDGPQDRREHADLDERGGLEVEFVGHLVGSRLAACRRPEPRTPP
jgi:hypothetical protein